MEEQPRIKCNIILVSVVVVILIILLLLIKFHFVKIITVFNYTKTDKNRQNKIKRVQFHRNVIKPKECIVCSRSFVKNLRYNCCSANCSREIPSLKCYYCGNPIADDLCSIRYRLCHKHADHV